MIVYLYFTNIYTVVIQSGKYEENVSFLEEEKHIP